jgi:flagellar hook-associated protein 1 FlgK
MSIAVGALEAQQAGLQTATNNLANLSTPGYSRQRVTLQEGNPDVQNGIAYGTGVQVTGIESLRNRLLDLQIADETQQQAKSQAFVSGMNQVQTLFPSDNGGIGQQITNFFNALNSLSTNPSDLSLRQSVLSAGQSMASSFNDVADKITAFRTNFDLSVQQDVTEVNQIAQQIATINAHLAGLGDSGQNYGSFLDQRTSLIQKLSGLIDVSVLNDGSSLALTTKQGAALVVDGQSFPLTTSIDSSSNTQHIFSQGSDMTSSISGGEIGGLLDARDKTLPNLQDQLDSLASGLIQNLNSANAMGFDLNGNPGGDLFRGSIGTGCASSIALATQNPALLAASSDATSNGDNGNLSNLTAVAKTVMSNGMTPIEQYGNLVFQVGSAISEGTAELDASSAVLQQFQQQNSTITGVSTDEEASHLLLYQRAYQAAAQAISAVDKMLQVAIGIGA